MAEFDFAPQPPHQAQDDTLHSPFAQGDGPTADVWQSAAPGSKTGPGEPLSPRARMQELGLGGPEGKQGLQTLGTLLGVAKQTTGHIGSMGSPTGLFAGLFQAPQGPQPHMESGGPTFNLSLGRGGAQGANLSTERSAMGNMAGPAMGQSKRDGLNQAMHAVSSLSKMMGGGMASKLDEVSEVAQQHLSWLGQSTKEMYRIRKK